MKILPLLLMIGLIFNGFTAAALCPQGDLNGDCMVSWEDLIAFAGQWLDTGECEGEQACANFDGLNGVDFSDFAVLASHWLEGIPLVINEFMASNSSASGIKDPQGEYADWIEIYNFGDIPINLAGMYLTDDLDTPAKWQVPAGFPSQTTIAAGGFLVFWADEDTPDGPLHTTYKLSAGGEEIGLFDTDGSTPIDALTFGAQTTNVSYGRYPDAGDDWRFFPTPTVGAINDGAYLGEIEDVEFSHTRGFYSASFNLTMACVTPGVSIYYTTNGKAPIVGEAAAAGSILYTAPVAVSSTKCVRAAAIKTGWIPSPTKTHTFIFGASDSIKSLPIYSIVGDEQESLFEPDGIMAIVGGYYDGNGAWTSGGTGTYNNPIHRGIEYERPVSFEIIDAQNYQIDCGIRVQGSDWHRPRYTRGDDWNVDTNKFSFKLFFRSEYGDSDLDYPLFPLANTDRYKSFDLRGGYNDADNPFIKDELFRRLHQDMGGVAATGTLVSFYLNGKYKSFFNPCGRLDQDFFRDYYDVNTDWDVITQRAVRNGDSIAWNAANNYCRYNDLSNTANYAQAGEMVDIVDFIDYLIVELYSGNYDWVLNNWTVSRERTPEGKFRFHCWDMELATVPSYLNIFGFDDLPHWDMRGLNGHETPLAWIYRGLKANPEFRLLFADRIQKHFFYDGALTPANIEKRFNELQQKMSMVIPAMDTYILTTWIPQRSPLLLAICADEGLFPSQGPDFRVNGTSQHGGYISAGDTLTMTNPSGAGVMYYTLDGSDPRLPGSKTAAPATLLVAGNAAKKVKVPTSDIGTTWRGGSEPYADSAWTSGSGGVGYERDSGYESWIDIDVESAMYNIRNSCYIRVPFAVDGSKLPGYTSLTLRVAYDDGFVAFINGTEVKRVLAPATLQWNSASSGGHESSGFESFDISAYINTLHDGSNILAIHGLNQNTTSSDFLISAELEVPGATIVVEPGISPSAILYTGAFTLDKTTNLRARVYKSSDKTWSPLNEAVYEIGNIANKLRITEIMYHPIETGSPDAEYIELKNISSSPINLNLVRFTKGIDFTFGPDTLAAGDYVLVVKDLSAFEAKYGTGRNIAGQFSGSLDNGGERIKLEDAIGNAILDFEYKDGWRSITDGDGYSLTIINPANPDTNSWRYKDSWRASAYVNGSPDADDSGIIPNPGAIVINEVLAHAHAEAPDWIELYNTTAGPIDISGWYLSDNDANPLKYRFATGTVIQGHSYIVVNETANFGPLAADPGRLIPFALSENGEKVCLTSALDTNSILTGYRENEDFGASETGVSFGRYYKGSTNTYNFVPMDHITSGAANAYPKVGPIVITEIMYHPDWPAGGSYVNEEYEYIELYNNSASPVTLYDSEVGEPWKFTAAIDYTFPDASGAVTIPAGDKIFVVKNPTAFSWRYPSVSSSIIYGPYSGKLANEGEQLELSKPGDIDEFGVRQYIRVERINYSDGSHPGSDPVEPDLWPTAADGNGKSLGRINPTLYGNDPNNWQAITPTPGL